MSGRIHGLNEKQRILKGWLQAVDSQLKETLQTVERFLPKIGISQLASAIALLTSVTNATKADMEATENGAMRAERGGLPTQPKRTWKTSARCSTSSMRVNTGTCFSPVTYVTDWKAAYPMISGEHLKSKMRTTASELCERIGKVELFLLHYYDDEPSVELRDADGGLIVETDDLANVG